jgi:hypothetical protein
MNDELSKDARTLLDAARQQGGPTTAQKARLTAAVMTATASTAAAMTTGTATGTSLVKMVGAGLIATIVGVSGTVLVKRIAGAPPTRTATVSTESGRRTVEAPLPIATQEQPAPKSELVVQKTSPLLEPAREPRPPQVPSHSAIQVEAGSPTESTTPEVPVRLSGRHTSGTDTTAAEVAALGSALEALEQGRALEAYEGARTARRSAPNGALRPELTVVEVEALCALQRQTEASELVASMPEVDRTPFVMQRLKRTCVGR